MTGTSDNKAFILGPSTEVRQRLMELCRKEGWHVETISREEIASRLDAEDIGLVFLPLPADSGEAMEVLMNLRAEYPTVVVVVYTSTHAIHPVVEAITRGAFDALEAPFHADEIRDVLRRVKDLGDSPVEAGGEYDLHIEQARRGLRFRRLSAAREHIRRALEIDPGRPEVHNLRGILYEIDGNRLEAQNSYRRALDIDPEYQPAIVNLEQSVEPGHEGSFLLGEVKVGRFSKEPDDQ